MVTLSTSSFSLFLITYQLKNLQGDLITNTISQSCAEIVSDIFSGLVIYFVGARLGFITMFSVTIIGCTMLMCYPEYSQLFVSLVQFGTESALNMTFIASVELIPTVYVAGAFGYCNVVARLLSMMSSVLAEKEYPIPIEVVLTGAIFASVVSLSIVDKNKI